MDLRLTGIRYSPGPKEVISPVTKNGHAEQLSEPMSCLGLIDHLLAYIRCWDFIGLTKMEL